MYINPYSARKIANTLAEQKGLYVSYSDKNEACTDGREIKVPNPQPGWNKDQWDKWWCLFFHEIGHNDPDMRDCFDIIHEHKINMRSFLGMILNILDDFRQERHKWDELAGRRRSLARGHELIMQELLAKGNFSKGKEDYVAALHAIQAYDTEQRTDHMTNLHGYRRQIEAQLTDKAKEYLAKLDTAKFDFKANKTAEQELKMVHDIIETLGFDLEEEKANAQKPEAGQGKGKEKGKGLAQSKNGDGSGYGDNLPHNHGNDSNFDEASGHHHTKYKGRDESGEGTSYTSLTIDYEGWIPEKGMNQIPEHAKRVIDLDRNGATESPSKYLSRIQEVDATPLSTKVKRLLQIHSKAKYRQGKKKGKLSKKNVYRVTMQDAPGFNERIFKEKEYKDILDTSVTVLTDFSGSMGGTKVVTACKCIILINEVLGKLGVPLELLTFTDNQTTFWYVHKNFNSKVSKDKLTTNLAVAANHMSSNSDNEAIQWAHSRLVPQPSKRKILIVLSDGQPASWWGDAYGQTIRVVKSIEERGDIEIYGIGIEDTTVKDIYKDYAIIDDASKLEAALFDVIRNKIINL